MPKSKSPLIKISEYALHYLALFLSITFLFAFEAFMPGVKLENRIWMLLYMGLCVGNYKLGTFFRSKSLGSKNKDLLPSASDIYYFMYSVASVNILISILIKFFVQETDSNSFAYFLATEFIEQTYMYVFVLAVLSSVIYFLSVFLSESVKVSKFGIAAIYTISIVFIYTLALTGQLPIILKYALDILFNPMYRNIFVLISSSPLIYYFKSLYFGSKLVDQED